MRAGRLSGPGTLRLEELPEPVAGPGEIVVSLAACGVCGTDLEKLRGNYRTAGRLGHEPVGVVAGIGSGVEGLKNGDRVFVHHHVPCYQCAVCAKGDYTFCPTYSTTNLDPGGFSERFRVPADNVRKGAVLRLDPSVGWDEGALLEPAGCVMTALRRIGFASGDSVFVVGLGPVGLLYLRLARALGASWVGGAEISSVRRAAATAGRADLVLEPGDPDRVTAEVRAATGGRGVDLSVVATGAPAAVSLARRLARRAGTLNLFGLPDRGSRLEADLQELYLDGIRIVPTYATTERDIADVHSLVVRRRLPIADLVTDRLPLEHIKEAFRRAGRVDEAIKVAVTGPSYAAGP